MSRLFGLLGVMALVGGLVFGLGCGTEGDAELEKVEYEEFAEWVDSGEEMVVIDVRPVADFESGHIQDAINVDLAALQDDGGGLIEGGKALTDAVPDMDTKIVLYCWGHGNDKDFGEAALELGYTNVYRYEWGVKEWVDNNYLVIEYESFKKWHEGKLPFDDGENYLIDDLPEQWYTGEDTDHPGGHIPGAINLPIDLWGDGDGPVNDGKAFTDIVTNKDAKVVIYCGNSKCGKSLTGVKVAVELGYSNVFRYQGGWQEWQDEGNELKLGLEP